VRILQIAHQFPPHHIGGVEFITHDLAHELAGRGHAVTVITRSPEVTAGDRDGAVDLVQWHEQIPTRRFFATFGDARSERAFTDLLSSVRFDIAHLQHLMGHSARLADLLRANNIPYVVSLHDYWYACANAQLVTNFDATLCAGPQPSRCGRCAAARAGIFGTTGVVLGAALGPVLSRRAALLRRILAHAALVTTPSRYVLDWFSGQGFDTGSWRVISYGLDLPSSARPPDGAQRRPRQVAYVGSIATQKGVHTLIEAFNSMPSDTRLVIAGPLNTHPDYVKELRVLVTHPGIEFAGPLTRAAVWRLLTESHTLVAPSIWPETYMLALHEALAAGCHVIASDLGAQAEAAEAAGATTFRAGDSRDLLRCLHATLSKSAPAARPAPRTRAAYAADYEAAYRSLVSRSATEPEA
jgi:glycosyltransferase involved in cell wall biosynthesis